MPLVISGLRLFAGGFARVPSANSKFDKMSTRWCRRRRRRRLLLPPYNNAVIPKSWDNGNLQARADDAEPVILPEE